jgi:hypothetical protein
MSREELPHDLDLLAAHLEDRLDAVETERLTRHLAGCVQCRETLAALARNADLLPHPTPAPQATRRVVPLPRLVWLPLAAALIVAVATLTRFDWRVSPGERRPERTPSAGPTPSPERVVPTGEGLPARPAPPPPSPPGAGSRSDTEPTDERVLVLRGTQRRVAGKTFRFTFGEWIDADFDVSARLPEVTVSSAEERAALLARLPALAPYAALGDRVRVVHDGAVYRFQLETPP